MTSLNGATVLITGANGGLGTALVHAAPHPRSCARTGR
jgi:NAD(P)-dependent dehydrogenase (short-subunit alcohol dehydrogenase family)